MFGLISRFQEVRFDAMHTPGPVHQPHQLVHILQLARFIMIIALVKSLQTAQGGTIGFACRLAP